MKKLFLSIALLFSVIGFSFAENVFSISVAPNFNFYNYQMYKTNSKTELDTYRINDVGINLGFDYKYITKIGLSFGAQFSLDVSLFNYGSTTGALNGTTLEASGGAITFAPIIGYRFGSNHLIGIELLPVVMTNTFFSDNATIRGYVGNALVELHQPITGNKRTYSTELRANIQFGNGLVRNGFIAGLGYTWLVDMSDVLLGNQKTIFSKTILCKGILLELGYKLSFVN